MAEKTGIEWTNRRYPDGSVVEGKTFNGWIGCVKVSPACDHCYAERDADERRGMAKWGTEAEGGTRKVTSTKYWNEPKKWADKAFSTGHRALVFTASWADVFEEWKGPMLDNSTGKQVFAGVDGSYFLDGQLPTLPLNPLHPLTIRELRARLFRLMARTAYGLDWLVLTKRAMVMFREWPELVRVYGAELLEAAKTEPRLGPAVRFFEKHGCPANVWPGHTIENQEWAMRRLPGLCGVRASRRFVSIEPQTGPVILRGNHDGKVIDYLADSMEPCAPGIQWVINGGESAWADVPVRALHPDWARSLRDQCKPSGIPFFFKQWGEVIPIDHAVPSMEPADKVNVWPDRAANDLADDEIMKAACREKRIRLPMLGLRVGKKTAGRELDGVTHDAIPPSVI